MLQQLKYDRSNFKGDLFGGVTAGVVALPLALAFGMQSGMGAEAGLYGAIAIGVFAAIFGGTSTQISGPTGPMTVVSGTFIASMIATMGNLEAALPAILATFLLAGAMQIALGVVRVGQYVKYIPYPVVSGFMSGIGAIIILLQLFPFFGQSSPKSIPLVFINIGEALGNMNVHATLLAAATIGIIYTFPKVTKAVPSTLVALIVVSLIPAFIPMDIPKIGDIPKGLPQLRLTEFTGLDWSLLGTIAVPAITLALLGTIDSLLTSIVADNITKTKHNSNRELIGQGIGNMVAAIIGGIPGAGATMRTVVNVKSGGRSRLSGVVHGVLLLVILLGAGRYAAEIPLAVLAGILITVGIGIMDYKGFRHIAKVPRTDAVIMLTVLVVTVFADLLVAVGVGMVLATFLFMKKMGDTADTQTEVGSLQAHESTQAWEDEADMPATLKEQVYVKHLYGPLFFGFTSKFQELAKSIPDVRVVIFRMERVPFIDQTGLYALEEAIEELNDRQITVAFSGLHPQVIKQMKAVGIIPGLLPESQVFEQFSTCKVWVSGVLTMVEEKSNRNGGHSSARRRIKSIN
ncbi:MAG: SulP family inorganic anion transporter [Flavobacteriales bacterium]|nr:SulP family inorganic anion transporter [Flavobacteriales bacterium]